MIWYNYYYIVAQRTLKKGGGREFLSHWKDLTVYENKCEVFIFNGVVLEIYYGLNCEPFNTTT